MTQKQNKILAIYLHWPFCASKCPYCDFNSHVRFHPVDEKRFVQAFETEMETMRLRVGSAEVGSIFIGGGTPSLMSPGTVAGLINAVKKNWDTHEGIEITLEANPSSVEAGRFKGYRSAGVNRVSLGVQSLRDDDLRFLGRQHDVNEALHAIDLAREIFPRLSFDLIYARPGQSTSQWVKELEEALDQNCDHLSLYQLTIEEGTPFYMRHKAGNLLLPSLDEAAEMYKVTQEVAAGRGLPAYEISNHAKLGKESVHNLTYWRYGKYVGVGPGAHGRFVEKGQRVVTFTEKNPELWLNHVERQGHGIVGEEVLTPSQEGDEFLLMGLRLAEGIDPEQYEAISGCRLSFYRMASLQETGLIEKISGNRLRVTAEGMVVLDSIVADIAANSLSL